MQKPHPPIVVGGNGPHTLQRVVDYGDEWMPNRVEPGPALAARIAELERLAREKGRGPIPVSVFGVRPEAALVEGFKALGVHRLIFSVPAAPRETVLPVLDQCAELAHRYG